MNKFLKFLLIATVIVFVIINSFKIINPGVETQMVQHGEMEKSFSFEGMIIRDETLIKSDKKGVLEAIASENEMVKKGKHIASVYESDVDEETKKKLSDINERIREIENMLASSSETYSDDYRIESAITSKLSELSSAQENNNVSKIVSIKNDLEILNDKKNAVSADDGYEEQMLAELKAEKAEYEQKLSSDKQDLYSPIPGIFSTKIDGYEEVISLDAADNLTPDDFEAIKKTQNEKKRKSNGKIVCKIIDSFEWAVAVIATENELSALKTGDAISLRIPDSTEEATATISYISAPKNGKYVVVATSDVSCEWSSKERFIKIDFIKNKYSGLKVPSQAIRVHNNTTGVYVLSDGIVKFKEINIYYKDGKNAIVEENSASGGLLLYDEIIVSSGNYEIGKRLGKQRSLK